MLMVPTTEQNGPGGGTEAVNLLGRFTPRYRAYWGPAGSEESSLARPVSFPSQHKLNVRLFLQPEGGRSRALVRRPYCTTITTSIPTLSTSADTPPHITQRRDSLMAYVRGNRLSVPIQ